MLGDLVVNFMANARPFQQGVREVQGYARETVASVRQAAGTIREEFHSRDLLNVEGLRSLVPTIAAAATLGGAVEHLREVATEMHHLNEQARVLDMPVEVFEGFSHVAEMTGNDVGSVAGAMARLQKSIAMANAGIGGREQLEVFRELGLRTEELAALKPADQFRQIAIAINEMQDPARRTMALMELFGRSGKQMQETMREIAENKDLQTPVVSRESVAAWDAIWKRAKETSYEMGTNFADNWGRVLSMLGAGTEEIRAQNREWKESVAILEHQQFLLAQEQSHKQEDLHREAMGKEREGAVNSYIGVLKQVKAATAELRAPDALRDTLRLQNQINDAVDKFTKNAPGDNAKVVQNMRADAQAELAELRAASLERKYEPPAAKLVAERTALLEARDLLSPETFRRGMEETMRQLQAPAKQLLASIATPDKFGVNVEQFRLDIEKFIHDAREAGLAASDIQRGIEHLSRKTAGIQEERIGPNEAAARFTGIARFDTGEAFQAIAAAVRSQAQAMDKTTELDRLRQIAENTAPIKDLKPAGVPPPVAKAPELPPPVAKPAELPPRLALPAPPAERPRESGIEVSRPGGFVPLESLPPREQAAVLAPEKPPVPEKPPMPERPLPPPLPEKPLAPPMPERPPLPERPERPPQIMLPERPPAVEKPPMVEQLPVLPERPPAALPAEERPEPIIVSAPEDVLPEKPPVARIPTLSDVIEQQWFQNFGQRLTPPEKWQGPPIESPVERPPAAPEEFGPWKEGNGEMPDVNKANALFDKAIQAANPPAQAQASASLGNERTVALLEDAVSKLDRIADSNTKMERQGSENLLEVPA